MSRKRQVVLGVRLFAVLFVLTFVLESTTMMVLHNFFARLSPWAAACADAAVLAVLLTLAIYVFVLRPLLEESRAWRAANNDIEVERASLADRLAKGIRALERSEGQYKQLIDCAEVIILRWDVSGRITFINEFGERFFGYQNGALLGKGVLETIVPSAESLTGRDLAQMIEDLSKNPRDYSRNENENVRSDGTRVWISWTNTALYDDTGKPAEMLSIGIDVTQRRLFEQALAHAEMQSRSILESVGDGIYGVDVDGVATFVNPAGASMLGYDVGELIGRRMHELIHHHHRDGTPYPREDCPAIRAFDGGAVTEAKSEVFWRKNRSFFPVEFTSTPMMMGGAVCGAVVTFRDVTERDRIQQELQESAARIRTILETVADGIVTINQNGEIQSFNGAAERMFGYLRDEVLGQDVGVLMPSTLREGHRKGIRTYLATGMSDILGTSREVIASRKSGEQFPIDISLAETSLGDERIFTGVIRDITERKAVDESLRKLQRAVEASPVSVVITDKDATIEYVNPRFQDITGYGIQEVLGRNPRLLKSGELPLEFYHNLWATLTRGEEWHGEFHNRKKDGSLFWERASISPIRDEHNQITHFVAVKEDITEQRRVAEQLREAKEEAEAANHAKSAFLANMSHEIRTPLNAIVGYSQLLGRLPLDDKQREYLNTIVRSSDHLLAIINDILDMARIESGRAVLSTEDFDINQLLKDLGDMFRLRALDKGLALHIGRLDGSKGQLRADAGKLRQILINLLGNAIKFTERGEVVVEVALHCASVGPDRLEVSVADTGPGISPEDTAGLFDAFVQTAMGRATQGGTGLGLAISRKLAQAMGGDLTLSSQVGRGSVFTLSVAVEPPEGRKTESPSTESRAIRLVPGSPRFRILVADDVPENRHLVVEHLGALGFDVYEAEDGQDAIEKFDACSPHLVFMDMGMPVMDGYEATRMLKAREEGRKVPVIAMTARVLSDNREGILAAGVDDFLAKPFRDHEIVEMVGRHLGVAFVKEDPASGPAAAPNVGLDVGTSVAALPESLRRALREAVLAGRVKVLEDLLGSVAELDGRLAQALQTMVDNFEYRKLLRYLEP